MAAGGEAWAETAYRFAPVNPETAGDLERFSRAHPKFRYCSCMRWRLRSGPFREAGPAGRIAALAGQVGSGLPVGALAYPRGDAGERGTAGGAAGGAVGWCSIAPRENFAALLASRVIPVLPGERVWSVVCFFLSPRVRGTGLRPLLLEAACRYAAGSGAACVEAYPWPGGASYRYMGTRVMYAAAGFRGLAVPDGCRPVMRRTPAG